MTREKFIKKWLGNKDYQYTEQNRDLMRDDLDEVINQALRQPPVSGSLPHNGKPPYSCPNGDVECKSYPSCGCQFTL